IARPDDQAQDIGPTAASQTVSASIILKVRNPDLLERFVALTQEIGPTYHRFLSVRQFVALFAPGDADIANITRFLKKNGITVDDVYADHLVLKVSGSADAFNKVFNTDMHDFRGMNGRFHRPHHPPIIPVLFKDLLLVVAGLDDEGSQFHPMRVSVD